MGLANLPPQISFQSSFGLDRTKFDCKQGTDVAFAPGDLCPKLALCRAINKSIVFCINEDYAGRVKPISGALRMTLRVPL
jgi:hypothetical protein